MQQLKEIALRIQNPTKGTRVMYLKKMHNINQQVLCYKARVQITVNLNLKYLCVCVCV